MKKIHFLRTFGGLSVMLSVFLLLAILTNFDMAAEGTKYAFGTNENLSETLIVQSGRAFPPRNLVEGFFDTNKEGDIQTTETEKSGKEITKHYRAIHATQIQTSDKKPILKLQVYDGNRKSWKVTEITKIDKDDGTAYFLLKSGEDQEVEPSDFYTGTYQLMFE